MYRLLSKIRDRRCTVQLETQLVAAIRDTTPEKRRLYYGAWRKIMLEAAKEIFLVISALFPIVDPLGGSPIFLALTRGDTSEARRALSWRIAVNSFFLLVGSYLIGTYILDFFGISLPVVQVGGGLIVVSTGWAMLKQKPDEEHKVTRRKIQQEDPLHRAFYPLTLPLTVGPGSISVAITLGANAVHHHGLDLIAIIVSVVGSALIAFSILLCYASADWLGKMLGATAMTVIMQLASFLLVCIGVQILWNGASALLASVHMAVR
jgi:multiple antibiotic resistance protein